jgi:hypothetical protein
MAADWADRHKTDGVVQRAVLFLKVCARKHLKLSDLFSQLRKPMHAKFSVRKTINLK